MKTWRDIELWTGLAALAVPLLAGCSASSFIPEPQADPTRYFVLGAPSLGAGAVARAEGGPSVRLRSIDVASYLRTRPLIVRRGDNEIQFRDFARWGEPIEQGIARVLREELLARGAGEVNLSSVGMQDSAEFELSVRVLACEGEADGGVNFRAVWELARTGAESSAAAMSSTTGDYRAAGLRWDARNEATLAAGLSEALGGLATEIAAALKK